jgi:hypothetical protein
MREYDDDIRLYTPVLQRIIILVAVIVAVPVVLWTITAFVRSYVAPPRLPTFQPMALLPQSDSTAATPQANTASNPASSPALAQATMPPAQTAATAAISDGRSQLLDIRKPPDGILPQSAAVGAGAAPQLATATPVQPTIAQPAAAVAPPIAAQPMAPPASPAPVAPAPPLGTVQDSAVKGDSSATPSTADRSFAWPNPTGTVVNAGTTTGTATGPMVAAQDQPNPGDTATDDLPAAKPIAGRVPLPRRRPNVVAMVQPNTAQTAVGQPNGTQTNLTRTSMAQNSVPLPRARPADAPEPAAPVITNDASYLDRGSEH